jgi:hypothetical protein
MCTSFEDRAETGMRAVVNGAYVDVSVGVGVGKKTTHLVRPTAKNAAFNALAAG